MPALAAGELGALTTANIYAEEVLLNWRNLGRVVEDSLVALCKILYIGINSGQTLDLAARYRAEVEVLI